MSPAALPECRVSWNPWESGSAFRSSGWTPFAGLPWARTSPRKRWKNFRPAPPWPWDWPAERWEFDDPDQPSRRAQTNQDAEPAALDRDAGQRPAEPAHDRPGRAQPGLHQLEVVQPAVAALRARRPDREGRGGEEAT